MKILRTQRKQTLIALLGGVCLGCGTTEKLTFDHVFPETKTFDISQRLDWSLEVILPELQKCQLLCLACHGHKTRGENGDLAASEHGTISMYNNSKCRCADCQQVKSQYMHNYNMALA